MVAKLVLFYEGRQIEEYPLSKDQITIGRRADNDIKIDNIAVSGRHAKIITILNDSFLEDLNSTNGTYVNGSLVKKHAFQNGDMMSIGKHQLKYIGANDGAADYEKTMVIRPDSAGMPEDAVGGETLQRSVAKVSQALHKEDMHPQSSSSGSSAAATSTSTSASGQARLQVLSGANQGRELVLTKVLTTIGKPGFQIAAVTKRPQGYFIIHVDGGPEKKFPLINGSAIGTQARALQDHDVIEVAGVKMEFFMI